MYKIIAILLLLASNAVATGGPNWGQWQTEPGFQLGDYGDGIRLLGGYSSGVVVGEVLISDFKIEPWKAVLFSTLVIGVAGTAREQLQPSAASWTYTKC